MKVKTLSENENSRLDCLLRARTLVLRDYLWWKENNRDAPFAERLTKHSEYLVVKNALDAEVDALTRIE